MLEPRFEPPYVAVIFSNVRTPADDDAYAAMAQRMEELASEQPGFLGVESTRDPLNRVGITVSYWATEADAHAWRRVTEHEAAQRLGRERWYDSYRLRIATVSRDVAFDRA